MQTFSLKISPDKLCASMGFYLPVFSGMMTESAIMSVLYGRIGVIENSYSRVFHAVHITNNNIDPYLPHFLQ